MAATSTAGCGGAGGGASTSGICWWRTSRGARSTCTAGAAGQAKAVTAPASRSRLALDDIRLAPVAAGGDQAFFLELPGDGDDRLLRLFDVPQAHGAEHVHLLAQHLGGALGHVVEEARPELLAR